MDGLSEEALTHLVHLVHVHKELRVQVTTRLPDGSFVLCFEDLRTGSSWEASSVGEFEEILRHLRPDAPNSGMGES